MQLQAPWPQFVQKRCLPLQRTAWRRRWWRKACCGCRAPPGLERPVAAVPPLVPMGAGALLEAKLHTRRSSQWRRTGHISCLEGRALLLTMRDIATDHRCRHHRRHASVERGAVAVGVGGGVVGVADGLWRVCMCGARCA